VLLNVEIGHVKHADDPLGEYFATGHLKHMVAPVAF
jgi:hypothetical protein